MSKASVCVTLEQMAAECDPMGTNSFTFQCVIGVTTFRDLLNATRLHFNDRNIFFLEPPPEVTVYSEWGSSVCCDGRKRSLGDLIFNKHGCTKISLSVQGSHVCFHRVIDRTMASRPLKDILESKVEYYHAAKGVAVQQCAPVKAILVEGLDGKVITLGRKQLRKALHKVTIRDVNKWLSKKFQIVPGHISTIAVGGTNVKRDGWNEPICMHAVTGGSVLLSPTPTISELCSIGKNGDDRFTVLVKTLNGKTVTVKARLFDTIDYVKEQVEELERIPKHQQRLIHAGKKLEDDIKIESYGIKENSMIHMVLRLRAGMYHETSGRNDNAIIDECAPPPIDLTFILPNGDIKNKRFSADESMDDVKRHAETLVGIKAKSNRRRSRRRRKRGGRNKQAVKSNKSPSESDSANVPTSNPESVVEMVCATEDRKRLGDALLAAELEKENLLRNTESPSSAKDLSLVENKIASIRSTLFTLMERKETNSDSNV